MMRLGVPSQSSNGQIASVPLGQRGIIHTEGRNDMDTSQIMMFRWVVIDPDGVVALEDTDKTLFGVPPRGTEERMTPRFDLNKPGNWGCIIELLMNPDDPVVVARYEGALCVVVAPPLPVYAGTLSKMELEYDSTRDTIPVL